MQPTSSSVTLGRIFQAQSSEPLPLDVSLYIAAQLSARVAQVHSTGKCFGGFGPEQVKIDSSGALRIESSTRVADVQADLMSLGLALFQLLSGRGLRQAVEQGRGVLLPPSHFNAAVDAELDAVVLAVITPERSALTAAGLEEAIYGVFEELEVDPEPECLAPYVDRAYYAAAPSPVTVVQFAPKKVRGLRLLDFSLVDEDEENPFATHNKRESVAWLVGAVAMALFIVGMSFRL